MYIFKGRFIYIVLREKNISFYLQNRLTIRKKIIYPEVPDPNPERFKRFQILGFPGARDADRISRKCQAVRTFIYASSEG